MYQGRPKWLALLFARNLIELEVGQEDPRDLPPVVDAAKALNAVVVGRGKENALAFEAAEMQRLIVDQVMGVEDALVSAEDEVRRVQVRKVPAQPAVFRAEGV